MDPNSTIHDNTFRHAIRERKHVLSEKVFDLLIKENPSIGERMTAEYKERCIEDIGYHLMYLADAVHVDSYHLFQSYVAWAKTLFESLGVSNDSFVKSLDVIKRVIGETLPADTVQSAAAYLERAIEEFPSIPSEHPTALGPDNPLSGLGSRYLDTLLQGERNAAAEMILSAVERGTPITDLYLHVFQAVQIELGRLWQMNKVSVAEEHYCTAATQLIMSRLYPYIFNEKKNGRVFLGACVGDELHEIGVRMISDFFELEGWDTYFLGANTPQQAILDMVKTKKPHILGIGVTIAYNIYNVESIIKAVRSQDELESVKILVGGYPFNLDAALWKKVGADGYARNAQEAVQTAEKLIGQAG